MMLKFPSISAVIQGALNTVKRFPLPLLSATVGSVICIYLIGLRYDEQKGFEYLWKVVMCCWLGLNLFLALDLISERKNYALVQKYLFHFFALLLVAGYYFILPEFKKMTLTDITRYMLFTIGLHFLVAFAPFIARNEINGFWVFNKTLFIRFLISVLYAGVLYLGLALAILAVDQLFNVNIREERYAQLWFLIAGIFNTWFFLAGVPKNLNELESDTNYPKGLKIFTQFILLPLVTVYLVILYAYCIKIVIQWQLPQGWVSYLVNAFSVFGILSLLLIYPIRNEDENTWMKIFSRWFYRALFPLIILLGISIGMRVMQYGITENRYFVLIIALWLAGIAIYFLLSKTKNIKIIPISLCIIAFLSSFGPWSAFSVSEKSQTVRLEKLLVEEKILVDGKIIQKTDTVSESNGREIVSIVKYLDEHHGFDGIQPWFKEDLDSVLAPRDSNEYVNEKSEILALLGVEDIYGYYYGESDGNDTAVVKRFYYNADNQNQQTVVVSGFDYSCEFSRYFSDVDSYNEKYNEIYVGRDSVYVKYFKEKQEFILAKNGMDVLKFDLHGLVKKLAEYKKSHKKYVHEQIPREMMVVEAANDSVRMKLHVKSISGTISKDSTSIQDIYGMMLLKFGSSSQNITPNGSTEKH